MIHEAILPGAALIDQIKRLKETLNFDEEGSTAEVIALLQP
jgi:hypothetical protein